MVPDTTPRDAIANALVDMGLALGDEGSLFYAEGILEALRGEMVVVPETPAELAVTDEADWLKASSDEVYAAVALLHRLRWRVVKLREIEVEREGRYVALWTIEDEL